MLFRNIFYKKASSFIKLFFKKSFSNKASFFNFKNLIPPFFKHSFQKNIGKSSVFIKKNKKLLISIFIAFLLSDLLLIKSYQFVLPEKELPILNLPYQASYKNLSPELYKNIWDDNIFHTGPIPLQLKEEAPISFDPVLSALPFKLKGTIIHANPNRSVVTITAGLDNKTLSYQQGDIIEKQAEIKQISRGKVVFFNQNNNRLEYILTPKPKESLSISYQDNKPKVSDNSLVVKKGSNNFRVKRSDINEYLEKLPEILQQARVVPHRSERGGGIEGFRFASINKGSIFEELGFQKGDIIKEVDGEVVTNPDQALELFDKLKGSSGFKILVEKGGKDVYHEYNVNENAPIN